MPASLQPLQPGQFFRAGAVAVISNASGLILCCERTDTPGAWQLPQGGLKEQESPLQAAYRELREETGLFPEHLTWLASCADPLVYELPAELRNARVGRGQVLYGFLFRLQGSEETSAVHLGEEFRSWTWMSFPELLAAVVAFRKPVYHTLAAWVQSLPKDLLVVKHQAHLLLSDPFEPDR